MFTENRVISILIKRQKIKTQKIKSMRKKKTKIL